MPTHVPPPAPSLNGGLYTGAAFAPDAPWRNFPATPDGAYLTHYNLRSARPPAAALFQFQGSHRPGNNWSRFYYVTQYEEGRAHDLACTPCVTGDGADLVGPAPKFARYAYL